MKTKDMAYIALMAVLISVCSWLSIPAAIPFTMQTYAIFTALLLLGGRRGSIAVLLYILMGAVGLPVFAGFTGGVGKLMGPTGGYIVGFVFTALCYWLGERLFGKRFGARLAGMIVGLIVCYAFGTVWFVQVYSATKPISYASALAVCVFPFIIPDIAKMLLAFLTDEILKKHIEIE